MKRLIAILLILLLLFNTVGYYGLFLSLKYRHKQEMIKKFDAEEYYNLEPVILKIPLSIPYAYNSDEFERVDGEFEYQGEFYRMVKQRLSQDTLFVVCIKDHKQQRMDQLADNYARTLSERPSEDRSGSSLTLTFIKDYLCHSFSVGQASLGWEQDIVVLTTFPVFNPTYCPSIFLPPDHS